MATSSNATIQQLMNEVDSLDSNDESLEAKLQLIAQKVSEEQRKMKAAMSGRGASHADLVDPQDAFACEGCQ